MVFLKKGVGIEGMRRGHGKKTGSRDIGKKRHGRRCENLPKSPEGKTEVSTCLGSLFFTPPLNVSPPLTVHSSLDLPLVLGGESTGWDGQRRQRRSRAVRRKGAVVLVRWEQGGGVVRSRAYTYSSNVVVARQEG